LDVLTIGDALIAMTPSTNGPLRFVQSFEPKVGGAELNVAIGCSRLGLATGWISRLGKDEFGKLIYNFARGEGIDVSQVQLVEGYQTSLYFKEMLNGNNINSYYYRHNSPTRTLTPGCLDEEHIGRSKILHITGVFPAVDPSNAEIVLHLLKLAKAQKVQVSLDPNIRLKLWDMNTARQTLLSFMPYVDILMLGEEEAEILFGTAVPSAVFDQAKTYGIDDIVLKQGAKGAIGFRNGEIAIAEGLSGIHVVDEIGAGDGFASGYLYSSIHQYPLEEALRFSNAVAAHVITIKGDNEGLPSKEEVEILLGERTSVSR
jgi:2-dehydro-3-deoxygluconokinase